MNKKPHQQQTVQRYNYEKELLDDLREDLKRSQGNQQNPNIKRLAGHLGQSV